MKEGPPSLIPQWGRAFPGSESLLPGVRFALDRSGWSGGASARTNRALVESVSIAIDLRGKRTAHSSTGLLGVLAARTATGHGGHCASATTGTGRSIPSSTGAGSSPARHTACRAGGAPASCTGPTSTTGAAATTGTTSSSTRCSTARRHCRHAACARSTAATGCAESVRSEP